MYQYYNYTVIGEHIQSWLLMLHLLKYSIQIYHCVDNKVMVWLRIFGPYWCMYFFKYFSNVTHK